MKKLYTLIFLFSLLFSFSLSYALEVNTPPTLEARSNTSVTFGWEPVDGAIGYYVYHDTISGEETEYRNQGIDFIEETSYTLEGLEPATTYYVALTVVDVSGEESLFSPEAEFTTEGNPLAPFALESVEATAANELTLTFNADLDESGDTQREFFIIHSVTEEEAFVVDSELNQEDPKELVLYLDRSLLLGESYDFTILSIIDADGRNIESGIDALTNFQVPLGFFAEQEEDNEEEPIEQQLIDALLDNEEDTTQSDLVEDTLELSSAGPEEELTGEGGNAGTIIPNEEIEDSIEMTAEETDSLPQTGPEHVLLLVLALVFGLFLTYYSSHRRRS